MLFKDYWLFLYKKVKYKYWQERKSSVVHMVIEGRLVNDLFKSTGD